MFGPDVCGSTRLTHAIFNYPPKGDNLLIKSDVRTETDNLSHVYTLHVKGDNTFSILIDDKEVRSGKLEEHWPFLAPREIRDPSVSKPADWVDVKKIPDPHDVKPEGYDDIPAHIPDPEAEKPEDWDDEEDGEWSPPLIDNPDYKGEWKPKMIDNPEYKGEWVHPMIPNPDFSEDDALHARCDKCTHVGFELWQVRSGTIFDDIIVTDSIEEARAFAAETVGKRKEGEKAAYDAHKAEEAERRRKEREEDEKRRQEKAAEMDEEDDEDDEDVRDEL